MEEYLKSLEEERDDWQHQADWESVGRALYCKGRADSLTKIIHELELMISG